MTKENLLLLAHYNIWATYRLVQHLKNVSDDDFHKDISLFFKSISGTLNHLLLGEHYLWYSRFNDGISPSIALDTIVHYDKTQLLNELQSKSKHWINFIQDLDESRLVGDLSYQRSNGEALCLPFTATLMHVFNHGTHHRGQITAALTALGYDCPELDLVYMLAEQSRLNKKNES